MVRVLPDTRITSSSASCTDRHATKDFRLFRMYRCSQRGRDHLAVNSKPAVVFLERCDDELSGSLLPCEPNLNTTDRVAMLAKDQSSPTHEVETGIRATHNELHQLRSIPSSGAGCQSHESCIELFSQATGLGRVECGSFSSDLGCMVTA